MKDSSKTTPPAKPEAPLQRKLGADHGDTAANPRKHDNNFKQSKDLCEDRSIRQIKTSRKRDR